MSAPVYNIELCQGAIYSQQFQILEDDGVTPVVITGDYIAMQIRAVAGDPTDMATATTANGAIVINGGGTTGLFTVTLLPNETSAITSNGVYDIERSPGGDTNATVRVVQGRAVLSKEVTLV